MKELNLNNIVLLGALVLGGYFVLKYIMPLTKGLGDAGAAVGAVAAAVTTPVVPATPTTPAGPTPLDYSIPFLPIITGRAQTAFTTPVGGTGSRTPSLAAFLFPPLGILGFIEAVTKGPPSPVPQPMVVPSGTVAFQMRGNKILRPR